MWDWPKENDHINKNGPTITFAGPFMILLICYNLFYNKPRYFWFRIHMARIDLNYHFWGRRNESHINYKKKRSGGTPEYCSNKR